MIAGSSEEDDSVEGADSEQDQANIEEMRAKLLGGISSNNNKRNKDLQGHDDLDVQFGVGFGVDIGK